MRAALAILPTHGLHERAGVEKSLDTACTSACATLLRGPAKRIRAERALKLAEVFRRTHPGQLRA